MAIRYLVVAKSAHGYEVERYWLRQEATLWQVRASLQRDRSIVFVNVIELSWDAHSRMGTLTRRC